MDRIYEGGISCEWPLVQSQNMTNDIRLNGVDPGALWKNSIAYQQVILDKIPKSPPI